MNKKQFGKSFVSSLIAFSKGVSSLISFIILSAVYFSGIALTFVFGRIFGKRFLELKKKDSYWKRREKEKGVLEDYESQF